MIIKIIITICALYFLEITCASSISNESKKLIKIERVAAPTELSEGPHWDMKSQKLYYVDLLGGQIMRYDPATGNRTSASLNNKFAGVVVPVEDTTNQLVVAVDREVNIITWDGETNIKNPPMKKLTSIDTDRDDTRVNDGKCDSAGRFWIGTMAIEVNGKAAPNRGSLYRIDENGKAIKVLSPISIGNGLTWNLEDDTMYYVDTPTRQIWAFDYEVNDGTLFNKRVVFDLNKTKLTGYPDGMTNDADGNLWVALYGGKAVIQIDPTKGKLLRRIELPANEVTSVAFGGPTFEDLYVTTARKMLTAEEKRKQPDAGAVFRITNLGVKGLAPHNCNYSS